MTPARLFGWALLPWLALQGCATAPDTNPARSRVIDLGSIRSRSMGFGPTAPAKVANEVFPSGMRVVVREDPQAKQVTLDLSYRVGATDEPAGKAGLAELAARLTLMARHGGPSAPTLEARLEAADVTPQNVVTYDDTELWSTLAPVPTRFAMGVELVARRMSEPLANVTEEDFRRVRARQTDDLWSRYEKPGQGPARRWLFEKLLAGHPYGRPVGGTPESLEHLTLEDVRAFVKANYTPAHAVLVVSGPLPLADAKFEVAQAFARFKGVGSDTRVPPVERIPPPVPEDTPGEAPLEVVRGAVKAPQLHFLLTVPGRYSGKYTEAVAALEAMNSWMGANVRRDEYPLGRSHTALFQELDGLTVLDCSVDLMGQVREEEVRKLAASMRETFESSGERMLEEMPKREEGAGTSSQPERSGWFRSQTATTAKLRMQMEQELRAQSQMGSAVNIARILRATGRADIHRLREEQMNQALTYNAMSPYLKQYFRAGRVRTLLILP